MLLNFWEDVRIEVLVLVFPQWFSINKTCFMSTSQWKLHCQKHGEPHRKSSRYFVSNIMILYEVAEDVYRSYKKPCHFISNIRTHIKLFAEDVYYSYIKHVNNVITKQGKSQLWASQPSGLLWKHLHIFVIWLPNLK